MLLNFPEIEAEIFLTFIGVNWLKEITIICYKMFLLCQSKLSKKSFDLCKGACKE